MDALGFLKVLREFLPRIQSLIDNKHEIRDAIKHMGTTEHVICFPDAFQEGR